MANPEGGILGFIKKLFVREKPPQQVFKPKIEKKPTGTKEERKEQEAKAEEIIQELTRVTPSHPAHEILAGIPIDPKTIAKHPDLGNLLLDIIHTINKDPNKYHDPAWLEDKLRRLNTLVSTLGVSPDRPNVEKIEQNVEDLYRRSQRDRREEDVTNEVEKIKKGEQLPEGSRTVNKTYTPPADMDWKDTIKALQKDYQDKINPILTELNKEDIPPDQKHKKYQEFAHTLSELKKKAISTVDPQNPATFREYNNLQRVFDKLATEYTKDNPTEGGRLYKAMGASGKEAELIEKRIQSDENYRDYWFYHILENILYNHKGDPHRELYGLYEHSDMQEFLDIVRRVKDERGESIGRRIAERYDVLKNTIFQAHDMDYYAAHPQQDMKEFIGSTSLFLNSYIDAAVQDPMVSLAKRLYETALLHIRETNGGFIPRQWLQWEEGKMRASKLDDMVEKMLKDAIKWKQLYVTKIDKISGLPSPSVWNRKQIDPNTPYTLDELYGKEPAISEDWRRNLGDLKIASALKQAKGLFLVDLRMLEIIGLSKGTGTDFVDKTVSGFNSVPYEGIVRHIEPMIHYYGRYRVGMDVYDAFFNMMITDRPDWNPEDMKEIIRLHYAGDHDALEKYCSDHNLGDVATRLNEADNPFSFSGMWGTMTKWRVGDASADFDDWEREQAYASAVKLTTAGDSFSASERKSSFQKWEGTWAWRKAREYYIENHANYDAYREEFRQSLLNSPEIRYKEMAAANSEEFELHWRKVGINQRGADGKKYIDILTENFNKDLDPHKGNHPKENSAVDRLIKQLERAYKARVWVQTAMRSPLIVARELELEYEKHGYKQTGKLRKKIIWEILGIDIDEISAQRTPLAMEEAGFDRITDLEGAVAAVQQIAIRENRDLKDADFDAIDEPTLKTYAKLYWQKVKSAMFGDFQNVDDIYTKIGIKDPAKDKERGLRFYDMDWEKIQKIDIDKAGKLKKNQFIIPELHTELLNNNLIDRDWRHLFSTEDMGWEYLNIGALGERNPVRRAGDLGSHVEFGQLLEQYLNDVIGRPVPKLEDIVELQHKMLIAMAGDFLDIGTNAVGRVAYTTGRIFQAADWTWKLPFGIGQVGRLFKEASVAQIIHGRDRGVAWGPNEMLQYVQAIGSQILPKSRFSRLGGREVTPNSEWDRALMGKSLGGTKANAMYEILNMTVMIAAILTFWRAFTAKSEEEEEH